VVEGGNKTTLITSTDILASMLLSNLTTLNQTQFNSKIMFLSCPVSVDLIDAEWYQDVDNAKEDALDWSVELGGENVIVYQAVEGEDGDYNFNKLYSICA
jgi:hypothetical protein